MMAIEKKDEGELLMTFKQNENKVEISFNGEHR